MIKEYEVFVSDITSCGGEQYAKKTLMEVQAESPEAYVRENGRYPILEVGCNADGDTVILAGDINGNMLKYTFTEI